METLSRRSILGAMAALPAAANPWARAAKPPNILLLFPDQHRFDWTGANRSIPVRTPHLDWMGARGAHFTRAIVPSPVCAPSRACLASGKDYGRCRVAGNGDDFPLDQTTYYQSLRDAGYHVAACGKLDLHKHTKLWGLDGKRCLREWGFSDGIDNAGKGDAVASGALEPRDPYMAYLHRRGLAGVHVRDYYSRKDYSATFSTPLPEDAYCDNWIAGNGLDLLRRVPPGKPWHLAVNFTGPHSPMDITARMEKSCRDREFPPPFDHDAFPAGVNLRVRQNYTAMVENIDRWVGAYIEELRRRGELDRTLIVYSSDHGEMLGDHNRWAKSVPYQPAIGVPLVFCGPGVTAGRCISAPVSILDLTATFLDYAAIPKPSGMDSLSLRPLLEGAADGPREFVRSGLGNWRLVWDGRYKLIQGFDPRDPGRPKAGAKDWLLYDLETDPREMRNLAEKERGVVSRLAKLLVS